jgi:hypothetical protein
VAVYAGGAVARARTTPKYLVPSTQSLFSKIHLAEHGSGSHAALFSGNRL